MKRLIDYKGSVYNIVLPVVQKNHEVVIWNSRSGAIVSLEKEIWEEIEEGSFSELVTGVYFDNLIKEGILIPKHVDELNQIRFERLKCQVQYNDIASFVISPTLNCNFSCVYCFENLNRETKMMDSSTMEEVISYIKEIASSRKVKEISICWFGGEPLLSYSSVILPISKQLVAYCESNNMEYNARLMTNGFFLDAVTSVGLLKECRVKSIQISIDGTEEQYCRRKRTTSVAYDKVVDNVFALSKIVYDSDYKCKISIRLNTDHDNKQSIIDFYERMRADNRFYDNISFYIGKLINYDSSCDYDENTFSLKEFEDFEDGFDELKNDNHYDYYRPRRAWCLQHTMNCFCIGPEGELYKCEHDFGDRNKIVGNVREGMYFPDYLFKFMFQEVREECKSCKIFPVCLGGCPSINISSDKPVCHCSVQKAINGACKHYYYKVAEKGKQ